MDYESLTQYEGKYVMLTLTNTFWYKANIISVKKESVTFIELKGKTVSVHPSAIYLIEEIDR